MKTYRKILYSSLKHCPNPDVAFRAGVYFAAALGSKWAREVASDLFEPNALHAEGTNTAGGYLISDEIAEAIMVNREMSGAIRRGAFIQPMSRDNLNIPRRTGGVTARAAGEGTTFTEDTPTLAAVGLVAKKWVALLRTSTELEEDAMVAFGDWAVGELAYAFAVAEDGVGFNGDGSSQYAGGFGLANALNSGAITTCASAAAWSSIAASDVNNMMAKALDYEGSRSQCFYCSKPFFHSVLERLGHSAGVFGTGMYVVDGTPKFYYGGYEVHFSTALPKTSAASTICAYFGDMEKAVVLGDRRQITVSSSEAGSVGGQGVWERDEISFKATERVDIQVADVGGSSGGPLVALTTHS